jgi:hypothetical protein
MLTCDGGERRGLEITRATDEELQHWMSQSPEGSAVMASVRGYAGDQIEEEWCRSVRQAVTRKLIKIPKYRSASHYDLLLPDDTRAGAGDRRKVLAAMTPWARDLKLGTPKLGKLSAVVSLDVIYDIGGDSRILPYIEWSASATQGKNFSDRVGHAARIAALEAIRAHKAAGGPIYFIDSRSRLVKETADGRRFEIRVLEDGQELVLRELSCG